MEPTAKDVMITRVVSVTKDASFRAMTSALREHRISAFPVLDDDGTVIGVVSEADMLVKEALDSEPEGMPGMIGGLLRRREHAKARGITAGDLMTGPAVTITPDDTIERAARLMYAHKVKRLPVVDANDHLVGIVSRSDLLSVFSRSDGDIRGEILNEVIRHELSTDPAAFTVLVKDGIVTLEGLAETKEFGQDIVHRVRHVRGVVAIRDRLSYPRPPEPDDHMFGPLVVFGLGGVAADVLADHAARLTPLTDTDADRLIGSIRSAPLLRGHRGGTVADLGALRNLLLRVSRLADDLPEVTELDLNPVIARPDGAFVVDARIKATPCQAQDPFLRKLR
jgi:CBS domain-containing protein